MLAEAAAASRKITAAATGREPSCFVLYAEDGRQPSRVLKKSLVGSVVA